MAVGTLGIVGGGQLGRMLAIAAARLGIATVVLDPDRASPAAQTASRHIVGSYGDRAALETLADLCDVVTYEFENIPVETVRTLEEHLPVHPGARVLDICQDRLSEKRFLREAGIGTAEFADVATAADLKGAIAGFGEGILKTRRFGYDGKGQWRLRGTAGIEAALAAAAHVPAIFETLVDFRIELSVIGVRAADGSRCAYDPAWNTHEGGILRRSVLPAPVAPSVTLEAARIAFRVMEALDYVGAIGIEFFLTRDDRLLVNEIAPRVHNSGHWTEAACVISQFENHVRAVCGLPLGDPRRHSDCEMVNLIGSEIGSVPKLLREPDVLVHLYGKREVREGRKMGHYTRCRPRREG